MKNSTSSGSNNNNNRSASSSSLDSLKYEVAEELGVDLKDGDNGHLTTQEAGSIGGEMVRRMIENEKRDMRNQS